MCPFNCGKSAHGCLLLYLEDSGQFDFAKVWALYCVLL